MDMQKEICDVLAMVREKKPLIHHLTNYVTANDCANIALAAGASPVMADDPREAAEMAERAGAVVINIGTLSEQSLEAMIAAGQRAVAKGIPVVFDPVGVGATNMRTRAAERIVREVRPSVVRGNMSEIKFLAGLSVDIKGVDSAADEAGAEAVALQLAQQLDCVIAITGKTDIIAQGRKVCRIQNGHALLASVTGTGCMSTTLAGCCCGAVGDPFIGTAAGIALLGIAGEMAQQSLKSDEGTGTFRMRLIDAVYNMNADTLRHRGKISLQLCNPETPV